MVPTDWLDIDPTLLWWLAGGSLVMFLLSPLVVAALVVRIPSDYFAYEKRHASAWAERHRWQRMLLLVLKNALGVAVVLAGVAMLVLPGQGVLAILMGIMLLDVPGKYRFERWLVMRPPVWRAVAWLRAKAGKDALTLGHDRSDPR